MDFSNTLLAPGFITPQDGHDKQDCEQAAAKRWDTAHASDFTPGSVTVLGDDLYSRQPLCELCLEQGFNFIFVCLPDSDSSLYEWLRFLEDNGAVQTLTKKQGQGHNRTLHTYRWVNQIPLRETQPALDVNWCEVVITKAADGSVTYRNAFITQQAITSDNVAEVAIATLLLTLERTVATAPPYNQLQHRNPDVGSDFRLSRVVDLGLGPSLQIQRHFWMLQLIQCVLTVSAFRGLQ